MSFLSASARGFVPGSLSASIRRGIPWLAIDGPTVILAFYAATFLRFLDTPPELVTGLKSLGAFVLPVMLVFLVSNRIWRLDRRFWRYATAPDVLAIAIAAGSSTLCILVLDLLLGAGHQRPIPLSVVMVGGLLTFGGFVATRYRWRMFRRANGSSVPTSPNGARSVRTLIYGAGESGQLLASRLRSQTQGRTYQMVGFLDDDVMKRGLLVDGIKVLGSQAQLPHLVELTDADLIVLAIGNLSGDRLRSILSAAQQTSAQIRIVPSIFEWMERSKGTPLIREVRVQDLLGRQPVTMDVPACRGVVGGKVVLVTGACGSIGSELCAQIARFDPALLVIVDNNESGLYDLDIELRGRFAGLSDKLVVADVTDERKMEYLFREQRPQVIFHAAAYKHVPLMESYPEEAVRVNIGGTRVVLSKARENGGERFVLVSTDKAVNPSSVMGATKRVAEMLVMSSEREGRNGDKSGQLEHGMLCTAVRFGNVLGSRGSVVPTFAKQIELGGPVTVTHPEMTRYFMDIAEAARLIVQAATLTTGADIFMLDMGDRIRIDDLARKMIRLRGLRPGTDIPIVYTGVRPGEKLHEELAYAEEEQEPTEHPSINRSIAASNGGAADHRTLEAEVDHLLKATERGDSASLALELLKISRNGAQTKLSILAKG